LMANKEKNIKDNGEDINQLHPELKSFQWPVQKIREQMDPAQ